MSLHFESGRFSFGPGGGQRPEPGAAFKILVVADLSGRQSRGVGEPLSGRRAVKVDIDNYDEFMSGLGVQVLVAAGTDAHMSLSFSEFDDFDPDTIYRSSKVFAELRALRKRLKDPATFSDAAAVVQAWGLAPAEPAGPGVHAEQAATDDDDLARLLGRAAGTVKAAKPVTAADQLIRSIVAPYIVPAPDPRQDQMLQAVDTAIAQLMRTILQYPRFKALESSWRGLHQLITGLETGEELEVWAMDATALECAADLSVQDPTTQSGLYDAVVRRPVEVAGGTGYSAIVFDHIFHPSVPSATLLGLLGGVARAGGAVVFGTASHRFAGVEHLAIAPEPSQWTWSLEQADGDAARAWAALREHEVAGSIGLIAPRVLQRLPYGPKLQPVDSFEFDELPDPPGLGDVAAHEGYLWGSGAWCAALHMGQVFTQRGWSAPFTAAGDVGGLPMPTWREGGESLSKPIAEVWLSDRATLALSERGLIPVTSIQHRDAVRVGPLRSIAADGALRVRQG